MSLANIISLVFLCYIGFFLLFIWPKNQWHNLPVSEIKIVHKCLIALVLLATILICILPMSLSPCWNGSLQIAGDKQQYGKLADALLEGHLHIDKGDIDPALEAMDNPYDTQAREKAGVKYHWDEVYYNNHYYTYFGIVPTLVLFIPYKLLTGDMLLSHQATQFFAALVITGLFYLFYILCKLSFPNFPFSLYLLLGVAFSIMCVGYSIAAPALYCTAIVSAIFFMLFCFIFLIKALWEKNDITVTNKYLSIGGLFGALAFGCRPPVALANFVIIAVILRIKNDFRFKSVEKIKAIALLLFPYFVIAALLMIYNYARFGNVFEFGVSYQLTITDQHLYRNYSERFNIARILSGLLILFVGFSPLKNNFPYITFWGIFINFPILLLLPHVVSANVGNLLKDKNFYTFTLLLLILPFIVAFADVYWTPVPLPRYQLDFCFLLCIITFIAIGGWHAGLKDQGKKLFIACIVILAFLSVAMQFLLFCVPYDGSYTYFYPETLIEIDKGLHFCLNIK